MQAMRPCYGVDAHADVIGPIKQKMFRGWERTELEHLVAHL